MKKIVSIISIIAIALIPLNCLFTANAEVKTNMFYDSRTVVCKMGSYYTGDYKFLTEQTSPEDGNPFADQYMAEEANGKYLVVEATLLGLREVSGICPEPTEVTLTVVAQSATTYWHHSANGGITFTHIGDTIKLSTKQLPADFSVTPDEYWQFNIQLGLTEDSPALINAVKGESKFEADIALRSYISDTPCLDGEHIKQHIKPDVDTDDTDTENTDIEITDTETTDSEIIDTEIADTDQEDSGNKPIISDENTLLANAVIKHKPSIFSYDYSSLTPEDFIINCRYISPDENLYCFNFEVKGYSYFTALEYERVGNTYCKFNCGNNYLLYDKANDKLYTLPDAYAENVIDDEFMLQNMYANKVGDINEDGEVDIVDIAQLRYCVIYKIGYGFGYDISDITNDGKTDIIDIVVLRNTIVNG